MTPQEQLIDFVRRYRRNTLGMVREVFGVEPDTWQVEFFKAVDRGDRRISVASGHGVGKTFALAMVSVNTMLTERPYVVAATAPTSGQMFDAYFAEVATWISKLPPALADLFNVTSDRITLKAAPSECFLTAQTARPETPEALAGKHAEGGRVVLIVDEASGVHDKIYESAAGSMSGRECQTILAGNPVREQGYFYDTHHDKSDGWTTFTVNCEDSKLVAPEFIEEMAATYGRDSNEFRVRVLGQFPRSGENTIIAREIVEPALTREIDEDKKQKQVWGLDVAYTGSDRCVLTKRRGNVVGVPKWWAGKDTIKTANMVYHEWLETDPRDRPEWIFVDVIGIGAGVVDRLREMGLPVRAINVAEAAAMNEKYANLRTELWFLVEQWFKQGAAKLPDPKKLNGEDAKAVRTLVNELCAVRYDYTLGLKLQAESKKAMKKRGVRSPDFGDSLVLTFAGPAASMIVGGKSSAWGKPLKRGLKGIV